MAKQPRVRILGVKKYALIDRIYRDDAVWILDAVWIVYFQHEGEAPTYIWRQAKDELEAYQQARKYFAERNVIILED